VTTLVVCIDRDSPVADRCPVVGRHAVETTITETGVLDPEDSRINCLLEGLRVADDLEADGDDTVVAIVGGRGDAVGSDREIARQVESLVAEYDPDSAVVVLDSADDERLVPIIESRVRVDAVDRVVVRQARDIESTYYLLKQFLADEELRRTVLVPVGIALVSFPILLNFVNSPTLAVGAIAAALGIFLIYKGLGIDEFLSRLPGQIREALYSGQVSLVTYVVAGGLSIVGIFAGALEISSPGGMGLFILANRFLFRSVPWLTAAALAASLGRLLDELLQREGIRSAYVNLPFGAVAVGLVLRGFSAYFLERAGVYGPVQVPAMNFGIVEVNGFAMNLGTRLATFIVAGILVAVVGVRVAAYVSETDIESGLVE
jgi:putative membrane protein